MGLLDIFKPGWKKDAARAAEEIEKSNNLMTVLKIHDECGFRVRERARIDAAFVRSLNRLAAKSPEAAEYLGYLAREGDSSLLRCHAAFTLSGRPGMKEILKANIAEAYADPGLNFHEHPEAWIRDIDDPGVIANALERLSASLDLRKKVIAQIGDQQILADIVLRIKDEALAAEVMDSLKEDEDIFIRIAGQSRHPRCVDKAIGHIRSNDVLYKIVMTSDNEDTALTALKRFSGSEEEYKAILMKNRFFDCRLKAVRMMGGVTPDLIASVKEENPKTAMELFEMANDQELIDLADMGLTRAAVMLTKKDPVRYYEKYKSMLPEEEKRQAISRLAVKDPGKYLDGNYDLLTEDAKKKIAELLPYSELKKNPERFVFYLPESRKGDLIDTGLLSQDTLERLAMEGYVTNAWDSNSSAVRAYRKITNMGRQERLLFDKAPDTFSGRKAIMDWREKIIRDLSFSDDIMWRVFQNEEFPNELRRLAVQNITDPDKLAEIAMGDSPFAKQAADRLPKNKLGKLRNSKDPDVAKMGMAQFNRTKVSRADEKGLLEIMTWELANSQDPEVYLKALDRLESQDALLKALSGYIGSNKRTRYIDGRTPWKPIGQKLAERITDGAGLAALCLEKKDRVRTEEVSRLRELIRKSDEEKKFTGSAVHMMMTGSEDDWQSAASLLAEYYKLPDAAHAAWRFGGQDFVRRILGMLNAERETGRAKELGSYLQFIYTRVPESHSMLSNYNGKSYVKHTDYIDSDCASRSRDSMQAYVLKLE